MSATQQQQQARAEATAADPGPSSSSEAAPEELSLLVSGESLTETYEVGEVLGQGHFAVVRRGRHLVTGEPVAIKAIAKGSASVRSEVEILRRVGSHPNIVALKDVFETDTEWLIVMELVTGGELFERLVQQGAYSEKDASILMRQIGTAIGYLHSQGVCHRDLKPENVLLSSAADTAGPPQIKICDFGLSVALAQDGKLSEKQGTWAYWAPEMFEDCRYSGKEVDMWSLGVMLYILLSGRHPFDAPGRSDAKMRSRIQSAQLSFSHEVWGHVSQPAKDLIKSLLQKNPAHRPDATALLLHPWMQGTDVSATPIVDSDLNLQEYQRMKKKLRTALVASMHQQASIRKRHSDRAKGTFEEGPARPPPTSADAGPPAAVHTGAAGSDIMQLAESDLLADAFQMFDPEGKGFVRTAEFPALIARLGQHVTPHEVQQMIQAMDVDGSGKIHYQQYLSMASASVKDQRRQFPSGTVIFREGDTSDYFYLITAGRVRKLTQEEHAGGGNRAPAIPADEELVPGDYFGTSAILGSGQRHSTMVAVTEVQVLALGRDDFADDLGRASSDSSRRASDGRLGSDSVKWRSSKSRRGGGASDETVSRWASSGGAQQRGDSARFSPEKSLRFIRMMSLNERRRYDHGDNLFRQGEAANSMFIIKSGRVEVSCHGTDGRKHLIGQRGQDESCGETSCLLHKPRNTSVKCISDEGCEALCISRDDFLELVRGSWDVRQSLIAISERHKREKQCC